MPEGEPGVVGSAVAGMKLGDYELLVRLATGGAANVFLALDQRTGGFAALKILLPSLAKNEDFLRMFLTEARLASELRHPNIVALTGFGEMDGVQALAMEYVFGASLAQVLRASARARQPLSVGVILAVMAKVCDALDHAHEAKDSAGRSLGLIHRDVTPQNILIAFNGVPKLTDFGIAKATDRGWETKAGIVKGKFSYMSPEQAEGRALDRRSDVFSLAVVLWEALTGQDLFKGSSPTEVLSSIRRQEIPAPSKVVPGLTTVVDPILARALQREADQRYPSAAALGTDIRALIARAGMRLDDAAVARELAGVYGETILVRGRALRRAMKRRIEVAELAQALDAHVIESKNLPARSLSASAQKIARPSSVSRVRTRSSSLQGPWVPAPNDALLAQVGTDDLRGDALHRFLGIEGAPEPPPEGWTAGAGEVESDSIVPELRTLSAEAPERVSDVDAAPVGGAQVSADLLAAPGRAESQPEAALDGPQTADDQAPLTAVGPLGGWSTGQVAWLALLAAGVGFAAGAWLF